MANLRRLAAKQRADAARAAERLARRRAARIAKKVARTAAATDGLADLPVDVAVGIEINEPAKPEPAPAPTADDSVPALVERLATIRERIWRLRAMFAVSLSADCAIEANRYLQLFQDLAAQLRTKDPSKLEDLVRGHESLLLAPALPMKQMIPLDTQRLCEMRWEAMTQPTRSAPKRDVGYVPDGLGWMV
ncbi:MAG: hypothetical protein WBV55_13005 [Candidatus Sulfotelmatobacter sp.]